MRNTLQVEELKEKSEYGDKEKIDKRKAAVDKLKEEAMAKANSSEEQYEDGTHLPSSRGSRTTLTPSSLWKTCPSVFS